MDVSSCTVARKRTGLQRVSSGGNVNNDGQRGPNNWGSEVALGFVIAWRRGRLVRSEESLLRP